MAGRGLLIAGLSSSSGKTLIALGLMRACRRLGLSVAAAKTGPSAFAARVLGQQQVDFATGLHVHDHAGRLFGTDGASQEHQHCAAQ